MREVLKTLDEKADQRMRQETLGEAKPTAHYFADVCYQGQAYTIEVPLTLDDAQPLQRLYADFLELHTRMYGHSTQSPARIVNLRSAHRAGGFERLEEGAYQVSAGEPVKGSIFSVTGETLAQACAVPIHLATLIPVVHAFCSSSRWEPCRTATSTS